jgi:hypothetical protein
MADQCLYRLMSVLATPAWAQVRQTSPGEARTTFPPITLPGPCVVVDGGRGENRSANLRDARLVGACSLVLVTAFGIARAGQPLTMGTSSAHCSAAHCGNSSACVYRLNCAHPGPTSLTLSDASNLLRG